MIQHPRLFFKVIAYNSINLPEFDYCCFSRALSWLTKKTLTHLQCREIQGRYNQHCLSQAADPLHLDDMGVGLVFHLKNTLPKNGDYLVNVALTGNVANNHIFAVKRAGAERVLIFTAEGEWGAESYSSSRELSHLLHQSRCFQVMTIGDS